jgi:hypothetical protein|uniref:MqsA n=1 Tax=Siphoviridae sp. ct1yA16 TaxID=2827767 RepID=A0A8S5TEJ5_9CAUD|nr:MAG TPA: MqsA [Siphoviridae sp. ct1yA16]
MSTYKSARCPHCGKSLYTLVRTGLGDYSQYVGLPYERCPHCKKIYSTGKKLYSNMNYNDQKRVKKCFIFSTISHFFTLYLLISIIAIILLSLFINNMEYAFIATLILAFLPCLAFSIFASKAEYESIKDYSLDDFNLDNELRQIVINNNSEDEALIDLLNRLK